MSNRSKWVVFTTAPDQLSAEMWRDLMLQAGINCRLSAGDTTGFLGVSSHPVRLMVREPDAGRARRTLDAYFGRGPDVAASGGDSPDEQA